jgi:hypothetical protein
LRIGGGVAGSVPEGRGDRAERRASRSRTDDGESGLPAHYYRPLTNVVTADTAGTGKGYSLTGHHEC